MLRLPATRGRHFTHRVQCEPRPQGGDITPLKHRLPLRGAAGLKVILNLKIKLLLNTDLKVDVSVRQPGGAAFVQEVDVFDEEAEERDHDLEDRNNGSRRRSTRPWTLTAAPGSPAHLLLTAVPSLRPLGGAAERSAIVAEVTGGVHLVLWGDGDRLENAANSTSNRK